MRMRMIMVTGTITSMITNTSMITGIRMGIHTVMSTIIPMTMDTPIMTTGTNTHMSMGIRE